MPLSAKDKLDMAKQELARIQAEIAAMPGTEKLCKYRECGKKFKTDDQRIGYCCREHYRLENAARTKDKNEAARQAKLVAFTGKE